MHCIKTLFLLFFFSHLQAQLHISVFPNLVGEELLDEVVNEYKPVSVLNYADARDLMYSTIYNENDSVYCVYTGHSLDLPSNVDPSTHLSMNNSTNGINCEHTYPTSKGAAENNGNPFSDMHHLFPTRAAANNSRDNSPFREINDSQTTTWFYLNQSQNNIPLTNIDSYSESGNGSFEPREDHKGNVARAVFYFFTMYKDDALNADPTFFESQREILCDWHDQNPVDSIEWERTYMIAAYQNDLPNPFVLDSTLAYRAFCGVITATKELVQPEVSISPNPVIDFVSITSDGENKLHVRDVLGRVVLATEFYDSIELDFSTMDAGTYFIIVNEKEFKVVKL